MQSTTLLSEINNDRKEMVEALTVQIRVIKAMILREIKTRFWQNRLGYFWAIFDPCLHMLVWFLIIIGLRGGGARAPVHSVGPLEFLATGILPYFIFIKTAKYLSKSVTSNSGLMTYPIVKFMDVIFARFILEGCTQIIVGILVFVGLILCGYAEMPKSILGLFLPVTLLLFAGLGFGTMNAVFCCVSILYRDVLALSQRLLYFTSGVFFLGDSLPPGAREWMSWNPIFHGVELFRSSYFANYESSWANPWYLFIWGLMLFLFGLCVERLFRSKLKEE